jgi:hypothetical protein
MDEQQQLHTVHATRDWVTLRHPLTGDVQEVEATPESLTRLMIQGYVQSTPATPAKEK